MRLIYFSPVPWESFTQRPHKFVEWFHKRTGESVLWVDPYPTRLPRLTDLKRLRKTSLTVTNNNFSSWLQLVRPRALPFEPIPILRWVNFLLWQPVFHAIDAFISGGFPLIVVGKPSALALQILKKYPQCKSLYDAMDDFPAFHSGLSRASMAKYEELIARRSNYIWTSSSKLKSDWAQLHSNVKLVHNGLDLTALPTLKLREYSSDKKVFGYVGTIASWFDWDWIVTLAHTRPNDEIRLIGPVFESSMSKLPSNVRLLPPCNHEAALNAMMDFDVGLIPFKQNELTSSVDPIKYYEYRVLDLPVISTNFGEMRFRIGFPGVFISHSVADIAQIAETALNFDRDIEVVHDFSFQNSWESRFDATKLIL